MRGKREQAAGVRRPRAVFRRYVLFQVPGWLLALVVVVVSHQQLGLPIWAAAALWLVWFGKDIALYPLLRASYEGAGRLPIEQLLGKRGVAIEPLAPRGYVRLQGELWQAQTATADRAISAGTTVEVVDARGLTLVVTEARTPPPA
jgi:membrane protein implicated in regulation of membrane protease activity